MVFCVVMGNYDVVCSEVFRKILKQCKKDLMVENRSLILKDVGKPVISHKSHIAQLHINNNQSIEIPIERMRYFHEI